ncbi:hypothetical protein T492DRAFT_873295 [Pavlovales sp. CCMP2436]|nr:hypothetical protein T492DRAFT_873295 [Pavlovales sp. CCMP2436]
MVAQALVCPITLDPLVDPVTTPCGHTYEREALEAYRASRLASLSRCSVCRASIPNAHLPYFGLGVNIALRDLLQERTCAQPASEQRESQPPLIVSGIVFAPGRPLGRDAVSVEGS